MQGQDYLCIHCISFYLKGLLGKFLIPCLGHKGIWWAWELFLSQNQEYFLKSWVVSREHGFHTTLDSRCPVVSVETIRQRQKTVSIIKWTHTHATWKARGCAFQPSVWSCCMQNWHPLWALAGVLAAPLPTWIPINAPERAEGSGLNAWFPALTWETKTNPWIPGFSLALL